MSRQLTLRCVACLAFALALVWLEPIAPASVSRATVLLLNLGLGLLLAAGGLLLEGRIRRLTAGSLAGGTIGLLTGAWLSLLIMQGLVAGLPVDRMGIAIDRLRPVIFVVLSVLGWVVGSRKGDQIRAERIAAALRPAAERRPCKVLDTSVIIDGRIADIFEAGFLDGPLVVPQFVLRELQQVADSSDALKRNRGRKGLDILQRIKKNPEAEVIINESEFPGVRDVDQKLIELALQLGGKIVTNDLNLNKVAQLRGVAVLNTNDLANALKPVVLPGETMKVFILKEGKEANQGVAYLDDGTMVVVDNARRQIGRTVEIIVTSVLQTTAGKMFFGRFTSDLDRPIARRPSKDREQAAGEAAPGPRSLPDREEAG